MSSASSIRAPWGLTETHGDSIGLLEKAWGSLVRAQYRPWLRQATLSTQEAPSGASVCVWVRFESDLDVGCATVSISRFPSSSVQHAVHESLDSSQGASRKLERIAPVVLEIVPYVHVRVCQRGEARAPVFTESLSEERISRSGT